MISASHGTHQMAIFPHGEIWAVNLVCLGSWCTSKIHYSNLFYSNPPFGRPGLSQPSAQLGARESHPRKASRSMRSSESGRSMLSKDLQLAKAPGWMGMGLEVGVGVGMGMGLGMAVGEWGWRLEVGGWGLGWEWEWGWRMRRSNAWRCSPSLRDAEGMRWFLCLPASFSLPAVFLKSFTRPPSTLSQARGLPVVIICPSIISSWGTLTFSGSTRRSSTQRSQICCGKSIAMVGGFSQVDFDNNPHHDSMMARKITHRNPQPAIISQWYTRGAQVSIVVTD